MKKTETELAWLAGIIDGEGNVALYPKIGGVDARISIASTNKRLVDEVERILSQHSIKYGVTSNIKKNKNHKKAHYVNVCRGESLEKLIPLVIPHLIIKGEVAKVLLNWVLARKGGKLMGKKEEAILRDYKFIKEYTNLI